MKLLPFLLGFSSLQLTNVTQLCPVVTNVPHVVLTLNQHGRAETLHHLPLYWHFAIIFKGLIPSFLYQHFLNALYILWHRAVNTTRSSRRNLHHLPGHQHTPRPAQKQAPLQSVPAVTLVICVTPSRSKHRWGREKSQ